MEDTLISFKTAKLAREKKCNMETLSYFNVAGEKHTCKYDLPDDIEIIKCYTQSLLQKWLREKHNIYIFVNIDDASHKQYQYVIKWYYNCHLEQYGNGSFSMEDALEQGLLEGLKLIK